MSFSLCCIAVSPRVRGGRIQDHSGLWGQNKESTQCAWFVNSVFVKKLWRAATSRQTSSFLSKQSIKLSSQSDLLFCLTTPNTSNTIGTYTLQVKMNFNFLTQRILTSVWIRNHLSIVPKSPLQACQIHQRKPAGTTPCLPNWTQSLTQSHSEDNGLLIPVVYLHVYT